MQILDKDHFSVNYFRYFIRFMIDRLELHIYNLMARPDIAKITSQFISQSRVVSKEKSSFTAEKIAEFELGEDPKQVQLNNGLAFVTSMKDAKLDVFNIKGGEVVESIPLPGMPVEVLIDGNRNLALVTEMGKGTDGKNSVIGVDLTTRKSSFRIETQGTWSKFMALRPNSDELWVSNWLSNNVSVINLEKRELSGVFPGGKTPRGLAFTPSGEYCYLCGYYSRDVLKIGSESKEVEKRILMPFPRLSYQGTPRHIVIDSDGKYAYVSNMGRGTVHKIDLNSDSIINTVYSGNRVATIELTPNGQFLACANNGENCISIISTNSLEVVTTLPLQGKAYGLDIDNDGKYLAAASFDKRIMEVFIINY